MSIVTLPMSRTNRTRFPFADTSILSAMLAPMKSIESSPASPSTVSLPSPGSQSNVSSPAPIRARSLPLLPSSVSLPSPPSSLSSPWPAKISSSPRPAARVRAIAGAGSPAAAMSSLPSTPSTASASVASWCRIATAARSPATTTPEASPLTWIPSPSFVPSTMTRSAWPSPGCSAERRREIDVHSADVGAGQVVDGDDVGPAERVEVDPLDAGGVHRDVAWARKN